MTPSTSLGLLLLRLSLGLMYLAHAGLKLFVFTLPGTAQFFAGQGLPGVLAYAVFAAEASLIGRLAKATVALADAAPTGEAAAHQVLADGSEVVLPLAGSIDVAKESARLRQELAGLDKQLGGLRQRLANDSFVSRAKPDVVEAELQKEREWSARRDQLAAKVKTLCGD